jgi:hypothetical protein
MKMPVIKNMSEAHQTVAFNYDNCVVIKYSFKEHSSSKHRGGKALLPSMSLMNNSESLCGMNN